MRRLITTDSHLTPPPQVFMEMPEHLRKYTEFLMRYEERDDGNYILFPRRAEMMSSPLPAEVKIQDDRHFARLVNIAFEGGDAVPGFTPEERLPDMKREGVEAQVLIGAPEFNVLRGPEVIEAQRLYCRLANDWLADTYKQHFDRFAPGAYLPWMDPTGCVTELERAVGMGLRVGVMPDGIWDNPYWRPDWEPLWDAAAGLDVPLILHIAAIRNPPPSVVPPAYEGDSFEGFYELACSMGRTLMSLALSGAFERHPDLRIVMTEGYAFWLAGAIQFIDHHYQGNFGSLFPVKKLEELPGAYIKRQAKATFMWDPVAVANREFTGVECLMWGNDYPHPEGVFPDSQVIVEKQFAGVPEAEVERMTFSTARDLYGFQI
jgi:predicted TIM-barrel fold metal-dependent hydrolase